MAFQAATRCVRLLVPVVTADERGAMKVGKVAQRPRRQLVGLRLWERRLEEVPPGGFEPSVRRDFVLGYSVLGVPVRKDEQRDSHRAFGGCIRMLLPDVTIAALQRL